VTPTQEYIAVLTALKPGDLGLLRAHARQGLDESVDAFDLFAGLWWPLRQKNQRAPKRDVAWLVAKLYAFCPVKQSDHDTLARQLRCCQPATDPARERFRKTFDRLLLLPLDQIEPALQWALTQVASNTPKVDWVTLTNDLWQWQHESTRLKWAEEFLGENERGPSC
jgi:CRISPR type I-E-associated protein CasB/Cse2